MIKWAKHDKETASKGLREEIIEKLTERGAMSFGDLVKDLSEPYEEVLKEVMEMKNKGIIAKGKNPPGYYSLA